MLRHGCAASAEIGVYSMMLSVLLGAAGGILLGWLQCRFLAFIIGLRGKPRLYLLPVKLLLWGGAMALTALLSVPALLSFAAGAAAAMLGTGFYMHRRAKEV